MIRCRPLIIIVSFLLLVVAVVFYSCNQQPVFRGEYKLFLAEDKPLGNIDVLTDKQRQYQGFSRQPQPCLDCGLLFIWPVLSQPTMVMREMNFALDFIWLRDKQMIQFIENAAPEGKDPQTNYKPDQLVDAVLEVPAGFIRRHNLQLGQSLTWR